MGTEIWVALIGASVGGLGIWATVLGARQQRKEERTAIINDLTILEKLDSSWSSYRRFKNEIDGNILRHLIEEKRRRKNFAFSLLNRFLVLVSLLFLPFILGLFLAVFNRKLSQKNDDMREMGQSDPFLEALPSLLCPTSLALMAGSLLTMVILTIRHGLMLNERQENLREMFGRGGK